MENYKIFGNITITNNETGESFKEFNKDITNIFETVRIEIKIKKCCNCDENINIDTDNFLRNRGSFLCKDCIKLL